MPSTRLTWAMLALGAGCSLAACGSGTSGVSTATVLGPEAASQANPIQQSDPNSRAIQVGATSARATKCGYNFDPARLKASYLASETQQGVPPDQLAKLEKTYDTTAGAVSKAVATEEGYCSDFKNREIKADLTRHLAGDFNPPPPKRIAKNNDGFLSSILGNSDNPPEKFGADTYFDPTGRPKNAPQ